MLVEAVGRDEEAATVKVLVRFYFSVCQAGLLRAAHSPQVVEWLAAP